MKQEAKNPSPKSLKVRTLRVEETEKEIHQSLNQNYRNVMFKKELGLQHKTKFPEVSWYLRDKVPLKGGVFNK